jgi:hypothetical protein
MSVVSRSSKPCKLVGADEMHLARQAGLVARAAQVVGEGRNVGGEFGGIVVDPGAARQLPGHEARPPRRAERRGGVGVGEAHRAFGQRLQVRRVQPVGRPVREQRAVQLIDHQETGMGIKDRLRYADLRGRGAATLTPRREMLERHREKVAEDIARLTEMLSVLDDKIDLYRKMEAGETVDPSFENCARAEHGAR